MMQPPISATHLTNLIIFKMISVQNYLNANHVYPPVYAGERATISLTAAYNKSSIVYEISVHYFHSTCYFAILVSLFFAEVNEIFAVKFQISVSYSFSAY